MSFIGHTMRACNHEEHKYKMTLTHHNIHCPTSIKQKMREAAHEVVNSMISHSVIKFDGVTLEVSRIESALRKERLLGLRGHWAYDLNRHFYLVQCLTKLKQKNDTE
jgi:predicted aspartyl protease